MKSQTLSWNMPDDEYEALVERLPDPWEGNPFGHMVFLSKYSRKKPDGSKETWGEVVRRCVEGAYSIQRDWTVQQHINWSDGKALRSAKEMFERMYTFKFTPPGRGLWMMGTEFVHDRLGSAALQNCAFVSTEEGVVDAAAFLMEASMLGVGVGFDTKAAGMFPVDQGSTSTVQEWWIDDSREGWVDATVRLLEHYFDGADDVEFVYDKIRPEGEAIHGFGGTAAGPEPLMKLHHHIREMFAGRNGAILTHRDVTDLMNRIGACVMAGNVRRSAEIALGPPDEDFINLKNYDDNTGEAFHPIAEGRAAAAGGAGYASNNSVIVSEGFDYSDVAKLIQKNGEPGLLWLGLSRSHGRLGDAPDYKDVRAQGTNPCGEQTLESYEMCNLVETYPSNHDNLSDYERTLKFAYLYSKSVTLMPTHWQRTNAIMLRNRRIGTSASGLFQFAEEYGLPELRRWLRRGYDVVQDWDEIYSEWLCVRESIKTTSVKPSGTVSKIVSSMFKGKRYAGITAGVHAPVANRWIQHIVLGKHDPVLEILEECGFITEPSKFSPGSVVAKVPVVCAPVRTQDEVSVWEKAALAATIQRDWADNSVSVTLDFGPDEAEQIESLLHAFDGQFKAVSFLPRGEEDEAPYPQMPMDKWVSDEWIEEYVATLSEPDFDRLYEVGGGGKDAEGERFCDTDVCEVPNL